MGGGRGVEGKVEFPREGRGSHNFRVQIVLELITNWIFGNKCSKEVVKLVKGKQMRTESLTDFINQTCRNPHSFVTLNEEERREKKFWTIEDGE